MKKEYEEVLDYLSWDWYDYDDEYCLTKFTPIMNDYLYFFFPKDNFVGSIKECADKFDPEEYREESMEGIVYDSEDDMNTDYDLYLTDGEEMKEIIMILAEELEEAEAESEIA